MYSSRAATPWPQTNKRVGLVEIMVAPKEYALLSTQNLWITVMLPPMAGGSSYQHGLLQQYSQVSDQKRIFMNLML